MHFYSRFLPISRCRELNYWTRIKLIRIAVEVVTTSILLYIPIPRNMQRENTIVLYSLIRIIVLLNMVIVEIRIGGKSYTRHPFHKFIMQASVEEVKRHDIMLL